MHVGIHHTGQHDFAADVERLGRGAEALPERHDPAARNGDIGRNAPDAGNHQRAAANDEIETLRHVAPARFDYARNSLVKTSFTGIALLSSKRSRSLWRPTLRR